MTDRTTVLMINPANPEPDVITAAAQTIRRGGLVAFPTETVYGLGANALDALAVQRVFAAKHRPASDPLIVHIESLDRLPTVAADIPQVAWDLASRFWPGPLTLILPRAERIPATVSAGLDTVAVRMPRHPVPLALLRASDTPIAAPSANLFMHTSPTTARHVLEDLEGRFEILLDGGPCDIGVESTVLDVGVSPAVVLRPGGTSLEEIREILPDARVASTRVNLEDGELLLPSPGMLAKHYAPRARLVLVSGGREETVSRIRSAAQILLDAGCAVGILASDEDALRLEDLGTQLARLGPHADLTAVARNLFSCIRRLDSMDLDVILAGEFDIQGLGLAIRDRLLRASDGAVLSATDPVHQTIVIGSRKLVL